MRLISQKFDIDIPYDRFIISTSQTDNCEIIAWTGNNIALDECIVMATYSTPAKAIKAMEMVRNAYIGLPIIFQNLDLNEDVVAKLKEWKRDGIVLIRENADTKVENNAIFQFPADSEIEV